MTDQADFQYPRGAKAKDTISGFVGTITGRSDYLTGCNQYLLEAKLPNGKEIKSVWFDEQRLEVDTSDVVKLPASARPGGGAPVVVS